MRLAVCALSAVLLSGCAWMPWGGGHSGKHAMKSKYGASQGGHYKAHGKKAHNPCQIFSPAQPIPAGCNPSQVTLASQSPYGGFPQQPDFSGGYTSQGYGSHVAQAGHHGAHGPQKPRLRKPKWRGQLSLGMDASIVGDYLDYAKNPSLDPALAYDPTLYNEGTITTSGGGGGLTGSLNTTVTTNTYTAVVERVEAPNLSFDDVHGTPKRISGGVEYIASPRTTFFANAGYSHAEGNNIEGITVIGELQEISSSQEFDTTGAPVGAATTNVGYLPNQRIATFQYDFTDLNRIDLEAGARHYFDPILADYSARSITPFVGVSAGASHYDAQSFDMTQTQLFYAAGFNAGSTSTTLSDEFYYQVANPTNTVELYDSQWVPKGALTAGVEWQVTPRSALAFETGLTVEGARDYANGEKGDENVAIPFTIRGSYNF